ATALYATRARSVAVAAAYERQAELADLGAELRGASQHLTDQVRRYTQFGDRRHYESYWTEVRETKTRDRVVARLAELNVPAELLGLIAEAQARSNALVAVEEQAMSAVEQGRLDEARLLVFGESYDAQAGRIMEPIAQFGE